MIVDNITGKVFLFYNYMDLEHAKNIYRFHVTRSSDNGKTWSKADDITDQVSLPGWQNAFKFITSGRGT